MKHVCGVGYKQVGMKKKGKRIVPNCVKEEGLRDWFGKSKSKMVNLVG
jgi:hypothetical protein